MIDVSISGLGKTATAKEKRVYPCRAFDGLHSKFERQSFFKENRRPSYERTEYVSSHNIRSNSSATCVCLSFCFACPGGDTSSSYILYPVSPKLCSRLFCSPTYFFTLFSDHLNANRGRESSRTRILDTDEDDGQGDNRYKEN